MRALTLSVLMILTMATRGQVRCTILRNATCGGANGIVSAVASFGSSPYTYSFDGGTTYQNSGYFTPLYGGTYTVIAKDALGRTARSSFTITNSFQPPVAHVGTTSTSCTTTDGTLSVWASGGKPPYEYSLDLSHWQSIGLFTNLAGGLYRTFVRDANGCISGDSYEFVSAACPSIAGAMSGADAGCTSKGSISFLQDYRNPHSYQFSLDGVHFQTSSTFSGLDPGVYTFYYRDEFGTVSIEGRTIMGGCELSMLVNIVHADCTSSTGSISGQPRGGTAPYQYSLDGITYQNSNTFTRLTPGNYTLICKDANSDVTSELVAVYDGCVHVSAMAVHTTCGSNNGKITAIGAGGTPPYRYSVDGINFQSGNLFSSLAAGSYVVTLLDMNGFAATTNATINPSINTLRLTINIQPATCILTDGQIIINGAGGVAPYTYSMDSISYQNSRTFSHLSSGQYKAGIRDATGCSLFTSPVVVPYVCFRVSGTSTAALCGNNTGSITASVIDGISPVSYSLNGVDFQTGTVFSNLLPGQYTVTAKDAAADVATTQVIIDNNCITVINSITDITCGDANGVIRVTAGNGSAPYSYSIDGTNFQASNTFTNLASGSYTVVAKDANGLIGIASALINSQPAPTVSAATTPATCDNNDGSITLMVNGGSAPFLFAVGGNQFQSGNVFKHVPAGGDSVFVKDANGCVTKRVVSVPMQNNLVLATGNDPTICEGSSVILSAVSNGQFFSWTPSESLSNAGIANPVASPSLSTQYFVTATRGMCSLTQPVSVIVRPAPKAVVAPGETICYGKNSQLQGSGGLTYSWTPSDFLSSTVIPDPIVIKPTQTITYSLHVTDEHNCMSIEPGFVTLNVTPPPKLFAGNDTAIAISQPVQLLARDVNHSGFTRYSWSPAYGLSDPFTASPITTLDRNIVYKITASTDAGCESSDSLAIKVYRGADIYVPNAFTPNNDGHNDLLIPLAIGIKELKYFAVYNRWGQQIYRTSIVNQGWNGSLNGVLQNAEAYVWMAEGIDFHGTIIKRKGSAVLIR